MNDTQQNIIPAQEGLKYIVAGIPLPVCSFVNYCGDLLPVVNFSMASDYNLQYAALQDRISNPDKYRDCGEDVDATIARLKAWLAEHTTDVTDVSA